MYLNRTLWAKHIFENKVDKKIIGKTNINILCISLNSKKERKEYPGFYNLEMDNNKEIILKKW